MIKKLLDLKFVRFLLVGGINTLFGYSIYAVFTYFTDNVYVAIVLSNIVAVLFNFRTYGKFVFGPRNFSRIYRFFGAYIFLIITQMILVKGLSLVGISNAYLAGGILLLPMAVLSFLLLKIFVFEWKGSE